MRLADHLSRAAQHETTMPKHSFQVFSVDLEKTNPMQALKISPERLEQLQLCTGQDESLQTLKTKIPFSVAGQHREIKHLLTLEITGTIMTNCSYIMGFFSKALE